jgi:hypothetical protein
MRGYREGYLLCIALDDMFECWTCLVLIECGRASPAMDELTMCQDVVDYYIHACILWFVDNITCKQKS